jgi:hypothetical protein
VLSEVLNAVGRKPVQFRGLGNDAGPRAGMKFAQQRTAGNDN